MSGILGSLLGSFMGQQGQQQQQGQQSSAMITLIQGVLAQSGGVQGLIQRFSDAGFGEHAQSWIQGNHVPMTGNQIDQVFSPDELSGWASQLGVDPDKMRVVLAEAMPHVVDHLTPNGQVPSESQTPQSQAPDLSGLVQRFFASRPS
jgi:uncharacterized protein YidB (DUF937 family)